MRANSAARRVVSFLPAPLLASLTPPPFHSHPVPPQASCDDPLSALTLLCRAPSSLAGAAACAPFAAFCSPAANAATWGLGFFCNATGGTGNNSTGTGAPPPSPSSDACVSNPTSNGCAGYVYPAASVQADIQSLCTSMPDMPGCSIRSACLVRAPPPPSPLLRRRRCPPGSSPAITVEAAVRRVLCPPCAVVAACKRWARPGGGRGRFTALCTPRRPVQSGQVADNSTSKWCQPMTLLATLCADMPTMAGCRSYRSLCGTAGSVVQQCKDFPAIPK